jgi:hypothetical protein
MASVVTSDMTTSVRDFDVNEFIYNVITRFDLSSLIELEPRQIENYVEMMFLEYKMYHGDGFTDYITVFNTVIKTFKHMLSILGSDHVDATVIQRKIDSFIEFRNREIKSQAYSKTDRELRKKAKYDGTTVTSNDFLKARSECRTKRASEIYTGLLNMYEDLRLSEKTPIYTLEH